MALYRRTRSTRLLVASLVMLSLLTITVDFRGGRSGPFEAVGRGALSVVGPLQSAVSRIFRPIGGFFSGLAHIGSLQDENRRLRAEVEALKRQNASTVSIRRAYGTLAGILKLKEDLRLQGPTASVIAQSVDNFEWAVTLDRGSSDGVKTNDPVVTGDGLVGHVVQVSSGWSRVQLIIDPESAVGGRLAASGETGLVVGRRDRPLEMELVSDEANVQTDEQVITSGYQGGLYPPGLSIGVVSHVYTDPGSLAKKVEVRPAVDFSSLEFVLVITGNEGP